MGLSSLRLKQWIPGFDPRRKPNFIKNTWVHMFGLPLELLKKQIFEGLGNSLGRSIAFEDGREENPDKCMVKILVELDL